ncbi:MAG TPA: MFS transporter [Lacipirellula sp.]
MSKNPPLAASDTGKWMALLAALLGWMFDGFEIGMIPLVGSNALEELLRDELMTNPTAKGKWFGVIMSVFLIGAATGGVVFGWLGDRIGRVRAMSLSILTYAVFTGLCGFATEAWHIAVLRFIASLGMGGEWSLGVALVTELWPNRSRAYLAGLIGAAANVGFLIVGLLSLVLVSFLQGFGELLLAIGLSSDSVDVLLRGEGWRLLMIAGALPALLVFFIRLFVPESHKWEEANRQKETSYWATQDLIGVVVGAVGASAMIALWSPAFEGAFRPFIQNAGGRADLPGWLTALRIAATVVAFGVALAGYIYPVVRYLGRAVNAGQLPGSQRRLYLQRLLLGACLAGIPLLGTWGSLQWAPKWSIALADLLPAEQSRHAKEYTQIASSCGAILGTILAAIAGGVIGRRPTYAMLCVGSFASLYYMYTANDAYGTKLLLSVFIAGGVTAAFYGWFPLYLPELFPTSIRATSQGFAYNFGRVLSAVGSLQTAVLTAYFAEGIAADRIEVEAFPKAGAALATIYLLGLIIIWFGPETKGKPLPD